MSRTSAILIAVGDELLEGRYPDSNSAAMAARLLEAGIGVRRVLVVGDDEEQLARAIRESCAECGLVITTGGLGPTLDDVTRAAAARAAGVALERSEEAWQQVCAWYERASRVRPDSNERQALTPAGARVLNNAQGTAPGFQLEIGEAHLFALPGPPREMQPMFEQHVLGWLHDAAVQAGSGDHEEHGSSLVRRLFHLFGLSESLFADQAGDWMARDANPRIGVTFQSGTLTVRMAASGKDERVAQAILEERAGAFLERFGAYVYSESEGDPAVLLANAARERGIRLALAESCTGGLVAARLAAVAGVSEVFLEGFVTYSNAAKVARLGVPERLLDEYGAVSSEVAVAMARGAVAQSGADAAVAVTGIAGPDGGSAEKPVGLVWFATCAFGRVVSEERRFPPVSRQRIQDWSATAALRMLTVAIEAGGAT